MSLNIADEMASRWTPVESSPAMKRALEGLPSGWKTRRLAPSLGLELQDLFLPDLDDDGIARIRALLLACPPGLLFSISNVFNPSQEPYTDAAKPAGPPPMMSTSYISLAAF